MTGENLGSGADDPFARIADELDDQRHQFGTDTGQAPDHAPLGGAQTGVPVTIHDGNSGQQLGEPFVAAAAPRPEPAPTPRTTSAPRSTTSTGPATQPQTRSGAKAAQAQAGTARPQSARRSQGQARPGTAVAVPSQQSAVEVREPRYAAEIANAEKVTPRTNPNALPIRGGIDVWGQLMDRRVVATQKKRYAGFVAQAEEADLENRSMQRPVISEYDMRRKVAQLAMTITSRWVLPPAIADSPVQAFVARDVAMEAVAAFTTGTKAVLRDVEAENPNMLSHTLRAAQDRALYGLRRESIADAIGDIFPRISPLEAAQRTAVALSRSGSKAARRPIEVVTNSRDDTMEVDAWQTANVVALESRRGGIVGSIGYVSADVVRPGGVREESFVAAHGIVKDPYDPSITLAFALEPGRTSMPGSRQYTRTHGSTWPTKDGTHQTVDAVSDIDAAGKPIEIGEPQDWGTLNITAVALHAARFREEMADELKAPEVRTIRSVSDAGAQVEQEVRSIISMPKAVRFLSDKAAIGQIQPRIRVGLPKGMNVIESHTVGSVSDEEMDKIAESQDF